MPDTRTARTAYAALLALMAQPVASAQDWSFPYWNVLWLDALLRGLAEAPRDGVAHVTAPTLAPTTALTTGGYLAAGRSLEVVQTFVDAHGRETDASPLATISTGTAITDPAAAPTFGAIVEDATGFDGGLLEVWFSWTDAAGGETVASPGAATNLPYRSGGLKNQVTVILPSTPAVAGAAGANVYIRHNGGNVVLAYKILVDSVSQATLTGTVADCYRTAPTANSTNANKAIQITGRPANSGESPATTRFYIRPQGEAWTDDDRRIKIAGIEEWDPATVVYPLIFTGAFDEITAGFPPPVSQVKAIRPTDLAAGESIGILPHAQLPPEAVLETELVLSTGEGIISGLSVGAHTPADMGVRVLTGTALLAAGRFAPAPVDLIIPAADPTNPRIDLVVLTAAGVVQGPTENSALKGTPAAVPAAPTTPAGALKLAEVRVDAAATSITADRITDTRDLIPTVQTLKATEAAHEADSLAHFTGTEKADRLLSAAQKTDLTDGGETSLHTHPGLGAAGMAAATELATRLAMQLLGDEEFFLATFRGYRAARWREIQAMLTAVASHTSLKADLEDHCMLLEDFASAYWSADGVITGLVASTSADLTMPYTAGDARVGGTEHLGIVGGSIALTPSVTNYVYVDTAGTVQKATGGWPAERHAKICTAVCSGTAVTSVDNTVKVDQGAYDAASDRLNGVARTETNIRSVATADSAGNYFGNTKMQSHYWTPGAGAKKIKVRWRIKVAAAEAGKNIRMRLCPNNASGYPDLGAVIETVNAPDTSGGSGVYYWLTWEFAEYTFGADQYHFVVDCPTASNNTNIAFDFNNTGGTNPCYYSTDGGATWAGSSGPASDYYSVAWSEKTWYARAKTGLAAINRLFQSMRKSLSDGSAWDAYKHEAIIECRVDAGGTWQAIPEDAELIPSGTNKDQVEVRARLRSLDPSGAYPIIDGLGVVWDA